MWARERENGENKDLFRRRQLCVCCVAPYSTEIIVLLDLQISEIAVLDGMLQ